MNALRSGIPGVEKPMMEAPEDTQTSPDTQAILDQMQQLPPEEQKALCMKMPACEDCPMNKEATEEELPAGM